MKKISLGLALIGVAGLMVFSIIAIVDSHAEDMASAIIVQILFGSLFIAGYIGYVIEENKK